MKIELKDDDSTLILDDSEFDVPGWIMLTIKNEDTGIDGMVELHIKDLMPAMIAFHAKYTQDLPDEEEIIEKCTPQNCTLQNPALK